MSIRYLLLLPLLMLGAQSALAKPLEIRGTTMGTSYQVKVPALPAGVDSLRLDADIKAVLNEIDTTMSTYWPESEVSRFNRAPAGEWFGVSPAVVDLVEKTLEISRATDGALDITVGPLVRLWHFGPQAEANGDDVASIEPPSDESIAAARASVGYQKLEVRREPPALRKQVDKLEIDLSCVGEGYAVDRIVAVLEKNGIEDYLVGVAGAVRAAGQRPDGKLWRAGVQKPLPDKNELQTTVTLNGTALATAGDYKRFFEFQGRRYSHIIDPATGRPIDHKLVSVSVLADSCLTADAWDTGLLVLGTERAKKCAEKHDVAALLLSRGKQPEQEFDAQETTAWRKRLTIGAKQPVQ